MIHDQKSSWHVSFCAEQKAELIVDGENVLPVAGGGRRVTCIWQGYIKGFSPYDARRCSSCCSSIRGNGISVAVRVFQCCLALGLTNIIFRKLIQTEARLKLKMVWRHGVLLVKSWNHHDNLHLRCDRTRRRLMAEF